MVLERFLTMTRRRVARTPRRWAGQGEGLSTGNPPRLQCIDDAVGDSYRSSNGTLSRLSGHRGRLVMGEIPQGTSERPRQPPQDLGDIEGLVAATTDGAVLMGSRCRSCDEAFFPPGWVCPSCASVDLGRASLGGVGTLYSYSIVHVSPSFPTPYAIGYIDLESGPRVLAHLRTEGAELQLEMPVQLAGSSTDAEWWFEPVSDGGTKP